MSEKRPSLFRTALQVSPERIALLNDTELNALMSDLFRAECYLSHVNISDVRTNVETKAKDDGCDGWTPKSSIDRPWFGSANTCWQFKSGSAGEPKQLEGEILKKIPRETLLAGGRFVVIASASTNGKKGVDDRLKVLRDEASNNKLPTDKIHVIDSEKLAEWSNQHLPVAARLAGRPSGLIHLDDWTKSPEHRLEWQATPERTQQLFDGRSGLDFEAGGAIQHLHIQGPPGVGKTRFALELCRTAAWRDTVIYIHDAEDSRLTELIGTVSAEQDRRLTLVIDEVQHTQLRKLRDLIELSNGRIHLVTIGHSRSPDLERIHQLCMSPLEPASMAAIVKGWYESMPPEHVDFVVNFADGYVRLARLASAEIIKRPASDIRYLLEQDQIRGFLDNLVGTEDRSALHVVAVLTTVGWTDDLEVEGKTIAEHFGLNWKEVCTRVERLRTQNGIIQKGGRYRYVSPTPLANHLAVEAWNAHPDLLRRLPDVLPNEASKDAYFDRIQSIASNAHVRKLAREELRRFFQLADFADERDARRWSALSSADPALAAESVCGALLSSNIDERLSIVGRPRRHLVGTLVSLAWRNDSHHDALTALALLAEAENETWSNNATGEFVDSFLIWLGQTAVPYAERLAVLDDLLKLDRSSMTRLVIRALGRVAETRESRTQVEPPPGELPERRWQPTTGAEHVACIRDAIARLSSIAESASPEIRPDLVKVATELAARLRERPIRNDVAKFLRTVRHSFPDERETLRRGIAHVIENERKHWKELAVEDLGELDALHEEFEDPSLASRLRQAIGEQKWDEEDQVDLMPLAKELLTHPEVLRSEWPWLTSGEAGDSWRLGEALGSVDTSDSLGSVLPLYSGRSADLRALFGYINMRLQANGPEWLEKWVENQLARDSNEIRLLVEAVWRCGATPRLIHRLTSEIKNQAVPGQIVAQLVFGKWAERVSREDYADFLQALADRGHIPTAAALLARRMESHREEAAKWKALALRLATDEMLIRSKSMTNYYWKEVAEKLIGTHAREVAAAIFRAQADRNSGFWQARHSDHAQEIIEECVKHDAAGVWQSLAPHLADPRESTRFTIGFPPGLIDQMPSEAILLWVSDSAADRACSLARIVNLSFETDDSIASQILGQYGDDERIASEYLSAYVSGMFSGPTSAHWLRLATQLDRIAKDSKRQKLRAWALRSARLLREMAARDAEREEEEDLR